MARRATLIDSLRRENPDLIVLDAGNFADNTADVGLPTTQFLYRSFSRMGYDAVTLGARDLRHGQDAYVTPEDGTTLLATNLVDRKTGEAAAARYEIIETAAARVGVFSLLDPGIPLSVRDHIPELDITDPRAATGEVLDTFAREDVEVVVLLSQLDPADADTLLAHNPEIDVAVYGHPDATPHRRGREPEHAAVLFPRMRGQSMARARVATRGADAGEVAYDHAEVLNNIKPEPELFALIQDLAIQMRQLKETAAQSREYELDRRGLADRYLGSETCARCHQAEYDQWKDSPHAAAFETLVSLGMSASEDCVSCHVVGHGEPSGFVVAGAEPDLRGVGCESCHGIGSDHFAEIPPHRVESTCVGCHDAENSPDFDLALYLEKIRHW